MKQTAAAAAVPGSGRSEEIADGHDGWIMRQIESGRPEPGIRVDRRMDTIRFSHRISRIASAVGDYGLKRFYHRRSDGSIAFFYSVKGSFEHVTVEQLKLIGELLCARFCDDCQTTFFEYAPILQRMLEVKVSFQHSSVYLYSELRFGREWVPSEGFREV